MTKTSHIPRFDRYERTVHAARAVRDVQIREAHEHYERERLLAEQQFTAAVEQATIERDQG